jgi:hypothetical protein
LVHHINGSASAWRTCENGKRVGVGHIHNDKG